MASKVLNINNAEPVPVAVPAWNLASLKSTELIELHIPGNQKIEAHINPVDVIFYILEGSGVLNVENDDYALKKGDSISVKKDINRSWENKNDATLKLLVVKSLS